MSRNVRRLDKGFTVVEMITTVALIGLLVTPILGGIFNFYADVAAGNRQTVIALESQTMLRTMAEDLRVATAIDATNILADPNAPSGGWMTSSINKVLIISTPALDSSRNFIIDATTQKPFRNEIVYYFSDTNLYRRTLPNALAGGNAMVRSCPSTSTTSSCPADTLLSSKFDTSSYVFYDVADATTTTVSSARSVKITVSVKDKVFNRPITATNNIRITFRNTT